MELLVNRYRYPVNGAAGLVGNLIAESSVMPNRIEGSQSSTPMRAPDFTGRLRDFTPDQVRDRNFGRRTGPRHPGIGIAQWTSPNRREGLFRHAFRGRQLGSAILSDLDAQVDYLVAELHRRLSPGQRHADVARCDRGAGIRRGAAAASKARHRCSTDPAPIRPSRRCSAAGAPMPPGALAALPGTFQSSMKRGTS